MSDTLTASGVCLHAKVFHKCMTHWPIPSHHHTAVESHYTSVRSGQDRQGSTDKKDDLCGRHRTRPAEQQQLALPPFPGLRDRHQSAGASADSSRTRDEEVSPDETYVSVTPSLPSKERSGRDESVARRHFPESRRESGPYVSQTIQQETNNKRGPEQRHEPLICAAATAIQHTDVS